MKKRYYWKRLLDGGVLADPGDFGSEEEGKTPLNGYSYGFKTETEAHVWFDGLFRGYEYQFDGDYVLVEIYSRW